jgi:hypothetical protein
MPARALFIPLPTVITDVLPLWEMLFSIILGSMPPLLWLQSSTLSHTFPAHDDGRWLNLPGFLHGYASIYRLTIYY